MVFEIGSLIVCKTPFEGIIFQAVHFRITTLNGSVKVGTLNIEKLNVVNNVLVLFGVVSPKQISLPHPLWGQHLCVDWEIRRTHQRSSCSVPD